MFRISLNARTQAADAPDVQMDFHSCLRGFHHFFHDSDIIEGIDFHCYITVTALFLYRNFTIQQLQHMGTIAMGRHPQGIRLLGNLTDGQVIEYPNGIPAYSRFIGDKAKVRILLRGFFIVIAGAHLGGIAHIAGFILPCDDTKLGMHLIIAQAINDTAGSLLQNRRIVNVALFVKACPQLQHTQHILPPVCRIAQS